MNLINLKLAFRNLLRNKVYSFLVIGGFAIGFAACILIGLYYHTETTVNRSFPNYELIYRLYDVKKNRCNINRDLFPLLTAQYAAIDDACPLDYQDVQPLTVRAENINTITTARQLAATTENFFSIFSVRLTESTAGKAFAGNESISISVETARSLFDTLNPLGQKINVGNYFFGTVTSVFTRLPANSSFNADVILNSENEKFRFSSTTLNGKKYNPSNHFVLVKKEASPEDFINELNKSASLVSLDIDSLALQRLEDIYLSDLTVKSRHAKGNPVLSRIFLAISLLILFLSSINYLNYSFSMQYAKLRMNGIKKAFGAGQGDLAGYAVTEVALGMFISLLIAMFLTDIALSYSVTLFGKNLNAGWNAWLSIAPYFFAALLAVVLINSLIPVYIFTRSSIVENLSGFTNKGKRKQRWKHVLLIFQLTVSTALIAVVLTIFRQLGFVKHSDHGFDRDMIVKIDIPFSYPHTDAFRRETDRLPFVESTTLSEGCPGMINHRFGNNDGDKYLDVNCIYVGDHYLEAMGIKLLKGRDFLNGDLNRSCLINEEALKQFGWSDIEGRRFNSGQEGGFEVIGVVRDFKFESLHQAVEPLALLYNGAEHANVLSVRMTPGNTGEQINRLMETWKSFSSNEPFNFVFYDDFFQNMYLREEKLASSISFFSLIAVALTCMGILGHVFMLCLTRVKEIGIRKINGAQIPEILAMLNRNFIIWVIVATAVSTPVAFFIMRNWLENFAYKAGLNWWVFALSGLLALSITLITASWLSWRAATRNPVEAIRYE